MAPADKHRRLYTAGRQPPTSYRDLQSQYLVEAQYQKERSSPFSRAVTWIVCAAIATTVLMLANPSFFALPAISINSLSLSLPQNIGIHWPWDPKRSEDCRPPSANIFARSPPRPTHSLIVKSTEAIDKYLADRVSKPDIDSIAISLVTAAGPLWQAGYGLLRANDSELDAANQVVDGDSIYRIASVSKMFTVLETLILRERGALNWDDPVERYISNLTLPPESYGWAGHLDGLRSDGENPRVTLRDLASHLGGIGRDYPPSDIGEWPFPEEEDGSVGAFPVSNRKRDTSAQTRWEERKLADIFRALNRYPLVNTPQMYPIYSNTGIDLLGHANLHANALFNRSSASASECKSELENEQPTTHKELLHRDIFAPLHMNSTFFRLPASPGLRAHIAVPSAKQNADWADISLGDADDPAGGQYSSLSDLGRLMRTLLDPMARGGVIPPRAVREWLRPVHVWGETSKQVGLPWEISALSGVTAYTKGGNLPGYHSEFAILPEYSLGIILLVTGDYADTTTLLTEVSKHIIPTLSTLHNTELRRRYVGAWANGDDGAEITLDEGKGALHLTKLIVRGMDVVELAYRVFGGGENKKGRRAPIALWPTGRMGEFRLAFGRPELNDVKDIGCTPYWVSIDPGVGSRSAPLDLVYFKNGVLHYPSAGVSFVRQK